MLTREGPATAGQHVIPMTYTVYKPVNEAVNTSYPTSKPKIGWQDLILFYGTRIDRSCPATGSGDSEVAYTVPSGKVFFLLSCVFSVSNNEATARTTNFVSIIGSNQSLGTTGPEVDIITLTVLAQQSSSIGITPCLPIVMRASERIALYNVKALSTSTLAFIGYEVDAALFATLQ